MKYNIEIIKENKNNWLVSVTLCTKEMGNIQKAARGFFLREAIVNVISDFKQIFVYQNDLQNNIKEAIIDLESML